MTGGVEARWTTPPDEINVTVEKGEGVYVACWTIRPEPIDGQPDRRRYVCSGPAYGLDGFAFNDRADLDPDTLALMAMCGPGLSGDELLAKYANHFTRAPAPPPVGHTLSLYGPFTSGPTGIGTTNEGRCLCGQWTATSPDQEWIRERWREHVDEVTEEADDAVA